MFKFLKRYFWFVRIKSVKVEVAEWKHVSLLINLSKLKRSWIFRFFLLTVKLKSPISIILSYWLVSLLKTLGEIFLRKKIFGMVVYKYHCRASFVFSSKIQTKLIEYHLECIHCLWICLVYFHWCKIMKLRIAYFCLCVIFYNWLYERLINFSFCEQTYVNIFLINSSTAFILFLSELTFQCPIVIFGGVCSLWAIIDGKASLSYILLIELALLDDFLLSNLHVC